MEEAYADPKRQDCAYRVTGHCERSDWEDRYGRMHNKHSERWGWDLVVKNMKGPRSSLQYAVRAVEHHDSPKVVGLDARSTELAGSVVSQLNIIIPGTDGVT